MQPTNFKQERIFTRYGNYLVVDMFDINGNDTLNLDDVTTVVVVLPNDCFDAWSVEPADLVVRKLH